MKEFLGEQLPQIPVINESNNIDKDLYGYLFESNDVLSEDVEVAKEKAQSKYSDIISGLKSIAKDARFIGEAVEKQEIDEEEARVILVKMVEFVDKASERFIFEDNGKPQKITRDQFESGHKGTSEFNKKRAEYYLALANQEIDPAKKQMLIGRAKNCRYIAGLYGEPGKKDESNDKAIHFTGEKAYIKKGSDGVYRAADDASKKYFPKEWVTYADIQKVIKSGVEVHDLSKKNESKLQEKKLDEEKLSTMVNSYLETALWSSMDNSNDQGGEPLDKNYDITDLSPESIKKAQKDVDAFYDKAEEALAKIGKSLIELDDKQVGHDFWLTRNRHGAGFWDGDYEKEVGEILTDISHEFGETDVIVGDDKKLYLESNLKEAIHGDMQWKELPNGNLEVTVDDTDNVDLEDGFFDVFEQMFANGMDAILPEEIGALTDAPIFGETERDDHGELLKVHKAWWYPEYETKNPAEVLKTNGKIIFTKAPMDENKLQEKKAKWTIFDWAGNDVFQGKQFSSFDDADEFLTLWIEKKYPNTKNDEKAFAEERGEYVITQDEVRDAKYLDPKDPRSKRVRKTESKLQEDMEYFIEKHNGKFYVFSKDEHGNKYDSMHHFDTEEKAEAFIEKQKAKDQLQETGEPDQDYDKEAYDAIVKDLKRHGFKADHKEFDKYQGVYIDVSKRGKRVAKLWAVDAHIAGKRAAPKTKWASAELWDDGEKYSANKGDYFNQKQDKVIGDLLVLTDHQGKDIEIKNPKVKDLPDLTEVGWAGLEKGSEIDVLVLQPEGLEDTYDVQVKDGLVLDDGGLADYLKQKSSSKKEGIREAKKSEKLSDDEIEIAMVLLANESGLVHDGGTDNRLYGQDTNINYFVNDMDEEEYQKMEKAMEDFSIKGNGYEVYAWNDISGYDYWKKQGEAGDTNYIQVTVSVDLDKINQIDPKKLKSDHDEAVNRFSFWDNIERHDFSKKEESKIREGKEDAGSKIKKIEKIIADGQAEKIDGVLVDMMTANAIMTVYSGISGDNKEKYATMPIQKMASVAWKVMNKTSGVSEAKDDKVITQRKVKITLPLNKVAEALGIKTLETDAYDDIYHDGFSVKDIQKGSWSMPKEYDGAEIVFPMAVAQAMESAERSDLAQHYTEQNVSNVEQSLEKVSGTAEYAGVTEDGQEYGVSTKFAINSAQGDIGKNEIVIEIENPEHMINAIVDGYGMFAPQEIPVDSTLSDKELEAYFLSNIADYFEVYGERIVDSSDDRYQAGFDDDMFKEELNYRIKEEATADDVADALSNLEELEASDIKDWAKKAEKISGGHVKAKEIIAAYNKHHDDISAKHQSRKISDSEES